MFEIEAPESKEALRKGLDQLHAEIASYAGTFATGQRRKGLKSLAIQCRPYGTKN